MKILKQCFGTISTWFYYSVRIHGSISRQEICYEEDIHSFNEILKVSAKDLDTGKAQSIIISANDKMSDEEIEQAIRDAELYAEQDKVRRDTLEIQNEGNMALNKAETALHKAGKKLEKEEKKQIKADCNALRKLLAKAKPEKMTQDDSGSTTTNMVVINKKKEILASAIVRTGAKAQNGAQAALEDVCKKLGVGRDGFAAIMATGYGRGNIHFATDTKTEITCHARGAFFLNPSIRTIVDIGGQDSKVICLDETGAVVNFIMNDKCAAGTGRFLEMMARTLELDMAQMGQKGLFWKKDLTISSMCTVFAESEVISLIADNHTDSDIIHGLNKSIAAKTASMVTRSKGQGPYMMTGGVARNKGVVQALEERLGERLYITENPDLCGALGAALYALEGFQ